MAHQDSRFLTPKEAFKRLNVTELHRDLSRFTEKVKSLTGKSLVVLRGLPGSDKTQIAKELPNVTVFNMFEYLPTDKEDNTNYNMANFKVAHQKMRKGISKLIDDPKFKGTILVNAPHVYLWELKYYKAKACQKKMPLIIYEARTLFSKETEERTKQLADINIGDKITELRTWLDTQKERGNFLDTQKRLLAFLYTQNPAKQLNVKDKTNSFCPSVLLNIQLAAWLSSRCEQNVFMDIIWHLMQEWQEIITEDSMWRTKTPRWGW